jgi:pimeloyl-ACP methyl ester carboxylesterase
MADRSGTGVLPASLPVRKTIPIIVAPPGRVTTATAVRCAFLTHRVPTDWYLPAGEPRGLIWLQHGFTEAKGDWAAFASLLAADGFGVFVTTLPSADAFGCTLQNLGNNTRFLSAIADLFGRAGDPRGALATSYADALRKLRRPAQPLPPRVALVGHSVGGEAALYVGRRLVENYGADRVAGVVVADPVTSFVGDNTTSSLRLLNRTTIPVYSISAPSNPCNAGQGGTATLVRELNSRVFHGVLVVRGNHADLLGPSVGALERLACGTPSRRDTDAAQELAVGWLTDMLTGIPGNRGSGCYPGGHVYEPLLRAGVIATLP